MFGFVQEDEVHTQQPSTNKQNKIGHTQKERQKKNAH
jgi:hypothetical protein